MVEFITWENLLLEYFLVPGIHSVFGINVLILEHRWYHGDISPDEVEALLRGRGQDGSFLVRASYSSPGDYSLCVR